MSGVRSSWIFTGIVAMLLAGCGSGGGGSSSDAPPANSAGSSGPAQTSSSPELGDLNPTRFDFSVAANESTGGQFNFSNTGDAALTFSASSPGAWLTFTDAASGSVAVGANTSVAFDVTCAAQPLSGSITITTNDADENAVAIPVTADCTPPPSNFEINKVMLNQAARAFDSTQSENLSVGIIAGRELLVRAFVTGIGTAPDARVVISAPLQADRIFSMQTPAVIGPSPADESILSASHYAIVPGDAITADAVLRIEVDPAGSPVNYPVGGNLDLGVAAPGDFEVTFVPVTFEGQTPSIDVDDYMREALQVLPIGDLDVQVRLPYIFTGPFDLERLLEEIADLRTLDGSTRLYHGIIVPPGGASSGTAGVGYVGFPVSVSVDLGGSQYVIAHEMGHNINLGHAPGCGAPAPDPDYPYADGAVTTWGFDTTTDSLVAPASNRRDVMSYCNDLWVSDYHFGQAITYRNQSLLGFGPPVDDTEGLTISGRMTGDSLTQVRFIPTDSVVSHAVVDEQDLTYEFIAWDSNGAQIVSHAFNMFRIEDHSRTDGFVLSIPRPASAIDHYEIRRDGQTLDAARVAALDAPASVQVSADRRALVWQPRHGQTLVVTDPQGQVMSLDQTGRVDIPNASDVTVRVVGEGGRMTERRRAGTRTDLHWAR